MGNSFSITNTDSGWTVVKNGVTYTITDTNGDGKYDGKDKITFNDPNSDPLTPEDLVDIKFKTLAANSEGMTADEMAQYSNYREQKEAKEQQKKQQEEIQAQKEAALWQAQQPKKRNFWSKLAMGLGFAMPVLSGIGAGFIGASANSWQYGNCDRGLRWMSGLSSGMLGFSAGLSGLFSAMSMRNMMSTVNMNAYNMYPAANNVNNMMQSFYTEMNNRNDMYNKYFDTIDSKTSDEQETKVQKARSNAAENIRKQFQNDDTIPAANKEKLEEIAPPSKDSDDYTEEDEKYLRQLSETPYVPVDSIDIEGDQKGKLLSKEYALKINNAIKEYHQASAEDTEEFNNWKNNIEYLQKLISLQYMYAFSYESITNAIDEILNEPKKEKLTTVLTK